MLKFLRFLKSESERIAFVRTLAPMIWAFVLFQLADWGLQVDQTIADAIDGPGGIDTGFVNAAAGIILTIVLWVLARFAPTWFERIVMLIPVKNYAYTTPDETLVTPNGRVVDAASVIEIPPGGVTVVDPWVTAFLSRQPSEVATRAAAARLLASVETVGGASSDHTVTDREGI